MSKIINIINVSWAKSSDWPVLHCALNSSAHGPHNWSLPGYPSPVICRYGCAGCSAHASHQLNHLDTRITSPPTVFLNCVTLILGNCVITLSCLPLRDVRQSSWFRSFVDQFLIIIRRKMDAWKPAVNRCQGVSLECCRFTRFSCVERVVFTCR